MLRSVRCSDHERPAAARWRARNTFLAAALFVVGCSGDEFTCADRATCASGAAASAGASGSSSAGTSSTAGSSGGGGEAGGGAGAGAGFGGGAGGSVGGAAGSAGAGGSAPCNGACSGDTPFCNETTDTCVACLASTHCSDDTPVCDTETNTCVQCTASSHCSGDTPFCDTEETTCVTCLINDACTEPTASRCEAGQCTACSTNDDCAHIAGRTVCDAGECVECTGTDYAACGSDQGVPLVCDSLARTCTTDRQHSASPCQPCVSDAQCGLGQLCVLQTFGEASDQVGYFCHWKQGDTANGAPADCFADGRPFIRLLEDATSIDAQTADVCALRVSTCVARNHFSTKDCATGTVPAPDDSLCGFAPPGDAVCVQSSPTTYRCTMRCGSHDDCPGSGMTCNTGLERCEL